MAEGPPSGTPADAADPVEGAAPSDGGSTPEAPSEGVDPTDVLEDVREDLDDPDLTRRETLAYATGAGAGLGGWKALHNVVIGYGILAGTNLTEQDLPTLVTENFGVRSSATTIGPHEVRTDGVRIELLEEGSIVEDVSIAEASRREAERLDERFGVAGAPVSQLYADLTALQAGEATFAFSKTEPFFERVAGAEARPFTVDALRGPVFESPEADFVAEFADARPADAPALVEGLKAGFRQYSSYDIPRYAAGSVEDNVLLGAVDLRQYFESPTDFEALAAGENSGLFCTELVNRSIEAFHAVPATEQSPPIVAGAVYDQRHKHSYTILASVIREDGELVVPATFVDYTHSTLYDDLHLRWLLGEGLEAYNDRHRATEIFWNVYTSI